MDNTPTNSYKVYKDGTIGAAMSIRVPTCGGSETLQEVMENIIANRWDDINYVYVTDTEGGLLGILNMSEIDGSSLASRAKELMRAPITVLHPTQDQERAVFVALQHDLDAIPVVEKNNRFLGAVGAASILGIMHEEHLEDALITSGIRARGSHIMSLATGRIGRVVKLRAPWLIAGLSVGLALGFISMLFEEVLRQNIAIAFFIPIVAYIADSIGTQTNVITVRAMTVTKVDYYLYLLKELVVGFFLGTIVGALGGLGAAFISGSIDIGIVVGLSLLAASTIAAMLAATMPMIFKFFGKDPALGSGPLSTAFQDVTSILIYYFFALILMS